jgi:hypothetical protein
VKCYKSNDINEKAEIHDIMQSQSGNGNETLKSISVRSHIML